MGIKQIRNPGITPHRWHLDQIVAELRTLA